MEVKKDIPADLSISMAFHTFQSSKLLFYVSEASPTSKEFWNKGEAFHPQKELLLSKLVQRETEQLLQEQTLSRHGNSSSKAVNIHQMTRFGLGFLGFLNQMLPQHVTSVLQHSISWFSSIISTCYFKGGVTKTTHFKIVIYISYSSSM